MLVVDSSLALTWCFRDEQTPQSLALFHRATAEGFKVPSLWYLEVANVLQLAVRRKRITVGLRDASLADFRLLPVEIDPRTIDEAWSSTIHLAHRYDLTVYDAAYLELALRTNLPLASLDKQLAAAACQANVEVLP